MNRFIRRRLASFCIALVGVSVLSFILLAVSGSDPAEIIARRMNVNATAEQIEAIRVANGLDLPLITQYFNWIKGFFSGDLGLSIYTFNPVSTDIAMFFPVTLSVVGLAMVWVIFLILPLSLLSARFRGSVLDHGVRGLTLVGICLPSFWLGFMLLLAFAIQLPFFTVLPAPGIKGYILPSLALGFPTACSMVRLFRSTLIAELSSDYVQYARARGLSFGRILIFHVMKNAMPPIITLFCQYMGYMIAGSAVVESVFSISGLGSYLIGCITTMDVRAVASCIVLIAVVFVLANLMGDIINRLLCPWMERENGD